MQANHPSNTELLATGSDTNFARALAVLLVAVTWLFLPRLASPFDVKRQVASLGAIAAVLLFVARSPRCWRMPGGSAGTALALFISAAILSAAVAGNGYLSAAQLAQLLPFLALLLCLFNLREADAATTRIEDGMLIAALGVALFGLKQWLLPAWLDPGFNALGKLKIYSTLGNPNLAAFVLLCALPIAFLRGSRGNTPQRIAYAAVALLLMGCLLATQSRHALLIALALMPIGLIWLGSPVQRKVCSVALLLALLGLLIAVHMDLLPAGFVHTVKGRVLIWLSALQMIGAQPLTGVGLGQFELHHIHTQAALFGTGKFAALFDNAGAAKDAHNDYLQWGASAGVPGLAGFALLCAGALWQGWRSTALRTRHPGIYLALVACSGAMLFSAVLPHPGTALFFWVILGLALRHCALPAWQWLPGVLARRAAAVALSALLLLGAVPAYRELRAQLWQAQGDRLMQQHDLWLAQRAYGEALAWWPYDGVRLKDHATSLFLSGEPREALSELGQAARYSGDIGIAILQAEIHTRLGEYEQAIALYQHLIAAFPNMITPRFVLAQIYAKRGERVLAEEAFQRILAIQPSSFNLNMTREKVELQKEFARQYLRE